MDIQTYLNRPIPRSDDRGLGNPVPNAAECGEAIVDITNANPRIAYAASYAARGVQGGLTHCYVRAGVYERLKAALDLLPEEYSFLIYDTLRPLRVQEALFEEYIEVLKKEYPQIREKLWKENFWSQSFCLLTTGGAPIEVIRKYIESQGMKEKKGRNAGKEPHEEENE